MKNIFYFFVAIFTLVFISNFVSNNDIIPEDSIRVRVIANSNSKYDQEIKYNVSNLVQKNLYNLLSTAKDVDEAREIIKSNLDNINKDIKDYFVLKNYNLDFNSNFGYNYFPEKEFSGEVYQEGYYESLVITIGEGLGDNWWCVLFPPLCLVEAEENTEVEYTTFTTEIIDKYF